MVGGRWGGLAVAPSSVSVGGGAVRRVSDFTFRYFFAE
jgi:hypothetical protein